MNTPELEASLFIVKPDGMQHVGPILGAMTNSGLDVVGFEKRLLTPEIIAEHYPDHVDKPFFPKIEAYLTESEVGIGAVIGIDAISVLRGLLGATRPWEAEAGTLRARFGATRSVEESNADGGNIRNALHASDSFEAAAGELRLFLPNFHWFGYDVTHL